MRSRVLSASLIALAGVALAGCGHTESHAAMLRAPEPTSPGRTVELYLADQSMPLRPYYDIAIVQAIGFGSDATPEDVTKALTDKASSLGCDAVIRATIDLGYSRAHAAGVCVKYLGPGPAAPTPNLPPAHGANPTPPAVRPSPAPKLEPLPSGQGQGPMR